MNSIKFLLCVFVFAMSAGNAVVQAEILVGMGAPFSGQYAWSGEQYRIGAELAISKLNADGGVLGKQVRLIPGDDAAEPEQAVAVAKKFVSDGVDLVVGHWASGASIAASPIYAQADILMISPSSTNPRVTDEAGKNVFRVCGRDDRQGIIVGDYLADNWHDKNIAILHDGTAYGQGLADVTKQQLNSRDVQELLYEEYSAGEVDYSPLVTRLKSEETDVVFVGGYAAEASLMVREARDQNYQVQFVSGDAIATSDFWMATGSAGEGTLFTFFPDPRNNPANSELVEEFRAQGVEPDGYTLYAYAVVQIWSQAAEIAESTDLDKVVEALLAHQFDSVLGNLSFDENGDIKGSGFSWYTWTAGEYKSL